MLKLLQILCLLARWVTGFSTLVVERRAEFTGLFSDAELVINSTSAWPANAVYTPTCFSLEPSSLGTFSGLANTDQPCDKTIKYQQVGTSHTFSTILLWNDSTTSQRGFFLRVLASDQQGGHQVLGESAFPFDALDPNYLYRDDFSPTVDVLPTDSSLLHIVCAFFSTSVALAPVKQCAFVVWNLTSPTAFARTSRVFPSDLSYLDPRLVDPVQGVFLVRDRGLDNGQLLAFSVRDLTFSVLDFLAPAVNALGSVEVQELTFIQQDTADPPFVTQVLLNLKSFRNINAVQTVFASVAVSGAGVGALEVLTPSVASAKGILATRQLGSLTLDLYCETVTDSPLGESFLTYDAMKMSVYSPAAGGSSMEVQLFPTQVVDVGEVATFGSLCALVQHNGRGGRRLSLRAGQVPSPEGLGDFYIITVFIEQPDRTFLDTYEVITALDGSLASFQRAARLSPDAAAFAGAAVLTNADTCDFLASFFFQIPTITSFQNASQYTLSYTAPYASSLYTDFDSVFYVGADLFVVFSSPLSLNESVVTFLRYASLPTEFEDLGSTNFSTVTFNVTYTSIRQITVETPQAPGLALRTLVVPAPNAAKVFLYAGNSALLAIDVSPQAWPYPEPPAYRIGCIDGPKAQAEPFPAASIERIDLPRELRPNDAPGTIASQLSGFYFRFDYLDPSAVAYVATYGGALTTARVVIESSITGPADFGLTTFDGYLYDAGFDFLVPCPAGVLCSGGALVRACMGSEYCPPASSEPVPVAPNPSRFCSDGFCFPCPERFTCNGSVITGPCPDGKVCKKGSGIPVSTSVGSFAVQGRSFVAPSGTFAPGGEATPRQIAPGFYGPFGSADPLPCPEGYFCPADASAPFICPLDHYCPAQSSAPVLCPPGSHAPYGVPRADFCLASRFENIAGGIAGANAAFVLLLLFFAVVAGTLRATFEPSGSDEELGANAASRLLGHSLSLKSRVMKLVFAWKQLGYTFFALLMTGRLIAYMVSDFELSNYSCTSAGTEDPRYPGLRLNYLGSTDDATAFRSYYSKFARCPDLRCAASGDGRLLCSNQGFSSDQIGYGIDIPRTDDRIAAGLISPQSMLGCTIVRGMPVLQVVNDTTLALTYSTGSLEQWADRGNFVCVDTNARLTSIVSDAKVFNYLTPVAQNDAIRSQTGNPFALNIAYANSSDSSTSNRTAASVQDGQAATYAPLSIYRIPSGSGTVILSETEATFDPSLVYALTTDLLVTDKAIVVEEPQSFFSLQKAAAAVLVVTISIEFLRLLSFLSLNGRLALGGDYMYPLLTANVFSFVLYWALPAPFVDRIMIGKASEYVLHTVPDLLFIDLPQFALHVAFFKERLSAGNSVNGIALVLSTLMISASVSRFLYWTIAKARHRRNKAKVVSCSEIDSAQSSMRGSISAEGSHTSAMVRRGPRAKDLALVQYEKTTYIGWKEDRYAMDQWLLEDDDVKENLEKLKVAVEEAKERATVRRKGQSLPGGQAGVVPLLGVLAQGGKGGPTDLPDRASGSGSLQKPLVKGPGQQDEPSEREGARDRTLDPVTALLPGTPLSPSWPAAAGLQGPDRKDPDIAIL